MLKQFLFPASLNASADRAHAMAFMMTLPLAIVLLLGKCMKFWLTLQMFDSGGRRYNWGWLFQAITSSAACRVALVATVWYLVWARIGSPRWRWIFTFLLVFGFATARIVVAGSFDISQSYTLHKLQSELLFLTGAFSRDIGFLCLYFAFVNSSVAVAPKKLQQQVASMLAVLTTLLLLLAGLEMDYFSRTGQNCTAQVAYYWLQNISALAPSMADEVDIYTIAWILIGPSLLISSCLYVRRHPRPERKNGWWTSKPVVPAAVGLILVGPYFPQPDDPHYARFNRDLFIGLVRDLVANPSFDANKKVVKEVQEAGRPSWYSSDMKFSATRQPKKYNVVILMLESMRAKSTSLHDPALDTTPFLLRLSRHAAMIEQMHAVIPRTSSAWISVLYGMYPISDIALQPWVHMQLAAPGPASLPEILRRHGYVSAFFHSAHLTLDKEPEVVNNMRFDSVRVEKDFDPGEGLVNGWGLADDVMLAPIKGWIDTQARGSQPFFLTVMTNIGHAPYQTPKSWRRRHFTAAATDGRLNDYLNCVAYADHFAEALFGIISQAGLAESTIFVVMGDHGQGFGEHHSYDIRTLHQECLHIPTLIYAPQFARAPIRIGGPRQQIDLLPTIADLLGYRIENALLPGISLLRKVPPDRTLYFMGSVDESYLGMLKGVKKYIYNFDRGPTEIYDLKTDPKEKRPTFSRNTESDAATAVIDMVLWRERSTLAFIKAPRRNTSAGKP